MKRFGVWLAPAIFTSAVVGCGGGGVQEGLPQDAAAANPQPDAFRKQMEAQGKFMTSQKKKPAAKPSAEAKP